MASHMKVETRHTQRGMKVDSYTQILKYNCLEKCPCLSHPMVPTIPNAP